METGGGDGWWRRVVETGGGDGSETGRRRWEDTTTSIGASLIPFRDNEESNINSPSRRL